MALQFINYLGILGLILIALGWVPQTIQTIKQKKNNLNIKFNLLYTSGSLALLVYSIYIYDVVFILLNGFAFIMSGIGLFYNSKK